MPNGLASVSQLSRSGKRQHGAQTDDSILGGRSFTKITAMFV